MSWLVDNPEWLYIPLAIAALGLGTFWWYDRRVKFLVYTAIPLLLIGVVWLLAHFLTSDRKEIHAHIVDMANAVVRGDDQDVFKHVAKDFRHNELTREQLAMVIKGIAAQHRINDVKIWDFDIVDADHGKAKFKATVFHRDGSVLGMVLCLATFTREDGEWKLRAIEFRDPMRPEQPMPGAP